MKPSAVEIKIMFASKEKITLSDIMNSGISEYKRKHKLSSEHNDNLSNGLRNFIKGLAQKIIQ